jgi:isocitrate/isopropylmalate dehydrogenase
MLLDHIGERDSAARVERAVMDAVRSNVTTPDLGGTHGAAAVGDHVASRISDRV